MTQQYASTADVRNWGITPDQADDATVSTAITLASTIVDDYTGMRALGVSGGFASPVTTTVTVNDVRRPMVVLPSPFSTPTAVVVNGSTLDPSTYTVEPWGLRLYQTGMLDIDGFPRRALSGVSSGVSASGTPYGSKVAVTATYGYNAVPVQVNAATVLITAYALQQRGERLLEQRIQRLSIEGYLVQYDDKTADERGDTTGVPDADRLLRPFRLNSVQVG